MKKLFEKLLMPLCLGAVMVGMSTTQAAEDVPDHKLSEWKFGKTISGDEYKTDGLDGKVVVIEEWGVH